MLTVGTIICTQVTVFYISRSKNLSRVNSNPVSVFKTSDLIDNVNFSILKELWAPELHFIDGHWYIYFTAYDGEAVDNTAWNGCTGTPSNHRMYVLESEDENAFGKYTFKGQINELENDYINDSQYDSATDKTSHYAIDQTVFKWNNKLYAAWSGWDSYTSLDQRIYIAEMSNPYTISSNRVELSRPNFAYETYSVIPAINEAPQALISPDGNTLNLAFSVNRFDDSHYSLGLLTLKKDGDPLNSEDWIKTDKPIFETSTENSTFSVGHCSFVPSPDGSEYYVVYHARRGENTDTNPREIRVQQFYWNSDGTPCFGKAINASTLVKLPSGTAVIDKTTIEAENGTISSNAYIPDSESSITTYDSDYYSGGKRVALTSADSSVSLSYNAPKSGSYTLSLLASGNSSVNSGVKVNVNGTDYNVKFGGNGSNINNFYYYDLTGIGLIEGENTITVSRTATYKNGGYVDRIDIWNEADAEEKIALQTEENNACRKTPVIKDTAPKASAINPQYGDEYTFNSFGDFDKYWFSSEPFVDDPEYENVITTCRAGGNKRLLVTGKEFEKIADFKSSVEIIPAAAHYNAHNPAYPVTDETGINSGILFRIGKMTDYKTNVCTFDGYRCFITASNGKVKLQLSRYYFKTEESASSTNQVLKTATATLDYTAGDTYVLEVSCVGNIVNAHCYNKAAPETVISITNQSIVTSVAETLDSGKIGLFVNCGSRVSFANMKITPYLSSASLASDYGHLNELSPYNSYVTNASLSVSESGGVISLPNTVSKIVLKDDSAQNISDFTANAKIKITSSSALLQTGFCFRMSDVIVGTPGLTGYVIALQRTSKHTNDTLVVGLTKYGTKGTSKNVNLGNQSYKDTTLLSDITDKSEITGLEFSLSVTVKGNMLYTTVTRCDSPQLSSSFEWQIDNEEFGMNINYPVYYESGMIGVFSNGVAKISDIEINKLPEDKYALNIEETESGYISADTDKALSGEKVSLTFSAKNGYYLDMQKVSVLTAEGDAISLTDENSYWDASGVLSFTMPENALSIEYSFSPIVSGDSNKDGVSDVADLVRVKKYLADKTGNIALSNTDTDNNKTINATDLTEIRKFLINE